MMKPATTTLMLGAFVAAAYKVIPGISRIINYRSQVKTYLFTVNELAKANNNNVPQHQAFLQEEIQSIKMKNVCFSYGETYCF